MKIGIDEIKDLCVGVLVKKGLDRDDAEVVMDEYLYGELIGRQSHGFSSFVKFGVKKVKERKGDIEVLEEGDSYALIDGMGNLGQLVGNFAMEMAIEKAEESGVAVVGMNDMMTYLMPGYYAKMASDRDMIGLVIDNSKSRVAPEGGVEPVMGTNPIGLGIPTKDVPFVLDMATSSRAMGEVRLAQKLGEKLPEGMLAIDGEGKLTRDPDRVKALKPFGGYKGYGLSLAIEILAGSLVRAKMGTEKEGGLDRGFLFVVIDPEIFTDIDTFKEEASRLVEEVKSSEKAEEVDEILLPGENAQRNMERNLKNGYLDINDKVLEEIREFA